MTLMRKTAFTLTEVMFAVITLGIGLIMVAAVFPVAIQQTKLTSEEGIAASIAWTGMNQLSKCAEVYHVPPLDAWPSTAGVVQPLTPLAWTSIRGNLIIPTDTRYAFVPLYRRDAGAPTAQVFVVAVAARNSTNFVSADVNPALGDVNLSPKAVKVTIANGLPDGAPDTITFSAGAVPNYLNAIAEGTYVIISNDNITSPSGNVGRMNGRIYRVGNPIDIAAGTWELMPGSDLIPDSGINGVVGAAGAREADDICAIGISNAEGTSVNYTGPADAYIVGRSVVTPGVSPSLYSGPAMDVSAYTGFIVIKY